MNETILNSSYKDDDNNNTKSGFKSNQIQSNTTLPSPNSRVQVAKFKNSQGLHFERSVN